MNFINFTLAAFSSSPCLVGAGVAAAAAAAVPLLLQTWRASDQLLELPYCSYWRLGSALRSCFRMINNRSLEALRPFPIAG